MKILHLMLAAFYIDNYSYQENYLPKYHKQQGHDVEIIASLFTFDENGKGIVIERGSTYINEYGIKVTRLDYAGKPMSRRLRHYIGLEKEIDRVMPDVIFCHGVQFYDIKIVRNYCRKHKDTKLYVDNHSDFSNSATNWISKTILHGVIWKHYAQLINPYVMKFYGVLPARVDFLINQYGIPEEKVELLVMGADDESVSAAMDEVGKKRLRHKYGINDTDFLIVTGGKIDKWKTQTLLLMEAVQKLANKNVKLIVFGSVIPELKFEVDKICDDHSVQFIGWIKAEDSYHYFAAADLVVFPGRHSVFWEQVVAQGIPMIVKYWEGTTHVNIDGNVKFLKDDSVEEIVDVLEQLTGDTEIYQKMFEAAQKAKEKFLYSNISRKSIS